MRNEIKLILFILLMFGFANCTNQASKNSSVKIQFAAKGVSAQSLPAKDIGTLIVNVSGPGIEGKIVEQVECRNDGDICDSINITVPTGQDRLIQLLVVTKDSSDTYSDIIFYGDTKTAVSGETKVSMGIRQIASLDNEAQFSGQYIPSSNHSLASKYLSGDVEIEVNFPGKPTMSLGKAEIFAGWFDLFLVDGVFFRYFFEGWDENGNKIDKTEIFNDIHSGTGFELNNIPANGRKVAHFFYEGEVLEEEDGDLSDEPESFENQIFAFLGQSTFNVCFDNSSDFEFQGWDANNTSLLCQSDANNDGVCDDFLSWYEIIRSLDDTESQCTVGGTVLSSGWELNVKSIAYKDQFKGFSGPFKREDSASQIVTYDATDGSLNWSTHFGFVTPSIGVLTSTNSNLTHDDVRIEGIGEGYKCEYITSAINHNRNFPNDRKEDYGFQFAGEATQMSRHEYKIILGSLEPDLKVLICPINPEGGFYKSSFFWENYDSSLSSSQPIEVAIYDVASNPDPDFGFGASDWSGPKKYSTFQFDSTQSSHFFMEIKNTSSQSITIDQAFPVFNFTELTVSVDQTATSFAGGTSACGSLPITLNSNDICALRIDLSTFSSPSGSYHESIRLKYSSASDTFEEDIEFIVPVFHQIAWTDVSGTTIDMNVTSDEPYDVQYVRVVMDASGPSWNAQAIANHSDFSDLTITSTCPASLTGDGSACQMKIEQIGATVETRSMPDIGNFGNRFLNINTNTNSFSFDVGSSFSFPQLDAATASDSQTIVITNDATDTLNFDSVSGYNPSLVNGVNFTLGSSTCSSTLASGSSCNFDVDITHPGSELLDDRDQLLIQYKYGNTMRGSILDLEADFVP